MVVLWDLMVFNPLVIKHGNEISSRNGGFNGKISIHGPFSIAMFDYRKVSIPEITIHRLCMFFSPAVPCNETSQMSTQGVGVAAGPCRNLECSVKGCIIYPFIFIGGFRVFITTQNIFKGMFFGIMQPILFWATNAFFSKLNPVGTVGLE